MRYYYYLFSINGIYSQRVLKYYIFLKSGMKTGSPWTGAPLFGSAPHIWDSSCFSPKFLVFSVDIYPIN